MEELSSFNFSHDHDFSFGIPLAAADDQNEDLRSADAAEVTKMEEPKRRRSGPDEIGDPRERKKLIDKRYRDKVKREKEVMKQELEELKAEKGSLIQEIEHLRGENAKMNITLESSAEHLRVSTTSHDNMKRDFTCQESFLQALLSKLSLEGDMIIIEQKQRSEILGLKEAIIHQDMKEVEHIFERLLKENLMLKKENKVLEVKVEALCEKIHTDKL